MQTVWCMFSCVISGFWTPGVSWGLGRSDAKAWVVIRARARVARSDFIFVDSGMAGN